MAGKIVWHSIKGYIGIRYLESQIRNHNGRPDRKYYIRYQRDGKTVSEPYGWASEGFTPAEAAKARGEIVRAIQNGEGPTSLKAARETRSAAAAVQKLTFRRFWKEYLSCQAEKKAATVQSEQSWFKTRIDPAIGHKALVDISQIDIERIKSDMLKDGMAQRSIQYVVAIIRQVFNEAARRGRFQGDNPARLVRVRLGDNKRVRFLTRDEAAALLAELDRRSLDLHDIALMSLRTGMRAGEVFSLTWDCVDFDQGTLFIRDTKSGKNRHAFMTEDVKKMLMVRFTGKPGLVFPDRNGRTIKRISNSFADAVDALGLNKGITDARQKVVFHTLRHTFASWHVQNETPLFTVAKMMGHTTTAMTERYAHLAPGNMRGAVEHLEASLKEDSKVIKFRR